MSVLNSLSNEVDEVSSKEKTKQTSPRAVSPDPDETPAPQSKIRHIDDLSLSDDDDDMSDDGSIMRELSALRDVAKEIEREIASQDTTSMRKAIEEEEASLDPRKRLLGEEDHAIINRILDDELKNSVPKNGFERFCW